MKKYPLFFSVIVSVTVMVSCGQDGDTVTDFPPTNPVLLRQSLKSRSDEFSTIIDLTEAEYVATKFMNAPVDGVDQVEPKRVSNTITLTNNYNEPVMYAVNFESDGGYVIVSASKKTYPVVASSYRGSYNASTYTFPFIEQLIYRYTNRITRSFDYPIDSLAPYTEQWVALLPPVIQNLNRIRTTSASNYQSIIDKSIID